MKYIYIPNSFNKDHIESKFNSEEEFLECQIKYRKLFEEKLCEYIDFQKLDQLIKEQNIEVPMVEDNEYNFYHKYSYIGSKYIFIRNNYHVENLSNEEIRAILELDKWDNTTFNDTIRKCLYEEGTETFFGVAMDELLVKSDSLVFEFSYDQKKCTNMEQLNKIKLIIDTCFNMIKSSIENIVNSKCSFIVYNAIPDLFYQERKDINSK